MASIFNSISIIFLMVSLMFVTNKLSDTNERVTALEIDLKLYKDSEGPK